MSGRPDCKAPSACQAKGRGHCRSCSIVRALAARVADPHWRERLSVSARVAQQDSGVRAAQAKSRRANKAGARRVSRNAKAQMAVIRSDPAIEAKRIAAMRAAWGPMRARKAAALAAQYGFPVGHVAEFRRLRNLKDHTPAQAVAVLRASYAADFVAIDEAALLARRRAAGPVPAAGTEARTAWARKVNGEARP